MQAAEGVARSRDGHGRISSRQPSSDPIVGGFDSGGGHASRPCPGLPRQSAVCHESSDPARRAYGGECASASCTAAVAAPPLSAEEEDALPLPVDAGDGSVAPGQEGTTGVEVLGSGAVPEPWHEWESVALPALLRGPLLAAGFPEPSVIQQHAWPVVMAGRDLIGVAKTGSGKTLAFLLPCFAHLLNASADPRAPPAILVLAPTRELAVQIVKEGRRFGGPAGMKVTALYGGAPRRPQLNELRGRPQCIVATPGRLIDFLEPPPGIAVSVDVAGVRYLVIDEADRMLDMGFEPQIRTIVAGHVPPQRQTLLFTATWPASVRRLAMDFVRDPVEVRMGDVDDLIANADIVQRAIFCRNLLEKEKRLQELMQGCDGKVIVFVSTRQMCDELGDKVPGSVSIHGHRDQDDRDAALAAFRTGDKRVLIATDVVARGLDVKGIELVINFDPAPREEDYVHRIGRTGRAGMKGTAVSLLTSDDGAAAQNISRVTRRSGHPPIQELEAKLAGGELRMGGKSNRALRRASKSTSLLARLRRWLTPAELAAVVAVSALLLVRLLRLQGTWDPASRRRALEALVGEGGDFGIGDVVRHLSGLSSHVLGGPPPG